MSGFQGRARPGWRATRRAGGAWGTGRELVRISPPPVSPGPPIAQAGAGRLLPLM